MPKLDDSDTPSKLTRRVIVEKTGNFIFEWLPKTENSIRVRSFADIKEKYKIFEEALKRPDTRNSVVCNIIVDVVSMCLNRKLQLTPLVYDPDTFAPRHCILIFNPNYLSWSRLRTCISIEIIQDLSAYNHGLNVGIVFSELIEMLIESIEQEL